MAKKARLSTGIPSLDKILGGGLIPTKKTVVYGATGVGKSVLGVTLAHAGIKSEGHPGIIIDISSGADEQSQLQYAKEMLDWDLNDWRNLSKKTDPEKLHLFAYDKGQLRWYYTSGANAQWSHLSHKPFLRHHVPRTQRIIIDGSEPYETAKGALVLEESKKFFNYHAEHFFLVTISKHSGGDFPIDGKAYWNYMATDERIQKYLKSGKGEFKFGFSPLMSYTSRDEQRLLDQLEKKDKTLWEECSQYNVWDPKLLQPNGKLPINILEQKVKTDDDIIIFIQTTQERNIYDLVNRPIEVGSLDVEVNTVIVMGYFPVSGGDTQVRRGLAVVKHRGSGYDNSIREYEITDNGIEMKPNK